MSHTLQMTNDDVYCPAREGSPRADDPMHTTLGHMHAATECQAPPIIIIINKEYYLLFLLLLLLLLKFVIAVISIVVTKRSVPGT